MDNNIIGADCQLAYQLNYHPIFRISVFWTFLVSFFAIPGLCYFIIGRLLSLRFHGNLKFLLLVYFCNILLSAILSCFGFGYRFFVPFFAKTECDLLIDPTFFKYWHVTSLLVLTSSTLLPIGFSIERFVALKLVARYEHFRTILGPALVVILIGSDLICVKLIYLYETFSGPHLSLILVPSTSAMQFNIFFYFLLSVQLFNLVCNFFILKRHSRLKTRYLQRTETLSLRYEMEEIEQSSRFTLVVSFTHMLFVGCYIVCGIITRTVGSSFLKIPLITLQSEQFSARFQPIVL
uniref:Serpentine receptor class gamma n=1 Tax=Caenorhabditis tropicalis TaxID=1561998 RepID=A0A1I7TLG0_9PELO